VKDTIPPELEPTREAARAAIQPIRPADDSTEAEKKFLFDAKRTDAGRKLPAYYLVYFLLVDLLGFRDLGRWEKLAWSVPIDFEGRAFLIEHRKFGVGVFAQDLSKDEPQAERIVTLIKKGVKVAQPYFEWLADQAAQSSKLNVTNGSRELFNRFEFFVDTYRKTAKEAEDRKDERHRKEIPTSDGSEAWSIEMPAWNLQRDARWFALAAIDAFFSWTEHIFIHLAILRGSIKTGVEVAELAEADWQTKFKKALSLDDPKTKALFDDLIVIRRQLRNFIAHGAFGKQGEAFSFHSSAGAVPLLLPHQVASRRFAITGELAFEDSEAIEVIERFIRHMWAGDREPARMYIQESDLPLILTLAADGTYKRAMSSVEEMKEFLDYTVRQWDDAANMDW
jgi:hypothetical protein